MRKTIEVFRTEHRVDLTNGELQVILLDAVREEYPDTPFIGAGAKVQFLEDAAGNTKVTITWKALDRPVHVAK